MSPVAAAAAAAERSRLGFNHFAAVKRYYVVGERGLWEAFPVSHGIVTRRVGIPSLFFFFLQFRFFFGAWRVSRQRIL
jgi:hypothetical protein